MLFVHICHFRSYAYFSLIKCHMVLNAPRSTNGLFLYDLKEVKQEATKLVYELLLLNPASRSPTAQWLERSQLPASPGGRRKVSFKSGLNVLFARGQHSSLLVRTLGLRCGNTNINYIILLLSAKSRTVRRGWPRTPTIRRQVKFFEMATLSQFFEMTTLPQLL